MKLVRVAIVGGGRGGYSVLRMLKEIKEVEIVGISDVEPEAPGIVAAQEEGISVTRDFNELLSLPDLDVIIETTGLPEVRDKIQQNISSKTALMEAKAANLIITILKEKKEELLEIKRVKSQLSAILDSVQEAIEVADINGNIQYVNNAFSRVTGISEKDRIGQNIFEASPDGALASVLKTGKLVFGHRTKVGGSNAEVVSNAAPINVDGIMEGGVVVFQHFTDVMNIMEELKKSTTIIESLTDKLGQVTTSKYTFDDILGNSDELKRCINLAEKSARSNTTVLLLGESGTGKELFAHAIHSSSMRRENPFIKVNCAAIPETLLESEFFGYAKGAFTGAVKSKIGKFELAHSGTIFLDEIGDMNLILQGKLLRVLQEMEFERVGGNQTIKVDVRVIAATNRNLRELIRQGKFREDLFYRLNVVEITIPPLRVRKEDLPVLLDNLIVKLNRKLGKKVRGVSKEAEEMLYNFDWPGNVRELENVIERVMVTMDEEIINKKNLSQQMNQFRISHDRDIELITIDQMEEMLIRKAVAKFGNTVEGKRRASQALNISLATLYNKLKRQKPTNIKI
ncbi:sigma 54-interacting transcriptional regulator [Pelotomaculum propionicicum]|uniref:Nitrogen fixation protein VnfA n=1 Tax=Pelotomaculum propionicicum TaxID=258475 RepID=A0A4Y7RUW7_9FIRM|nr:sigma 54-interacting transcriptional regulator [Pelotomaculum propionicicum]NLI13736.1 sigma 54-interacting transcriptional regulator [Peptococcaceae bacterium]TEB12529.1 Nitrogen fixation protein VnfA [Pelotomaculum propionicicum]